MTTKFEELMQDEEFRRLYAIEHLIADSAQMICDLLEQKKMKKADLARLLKKSPAFVSQLLNGKANMTIQTLAEIVHALDAYVKIRACDLSAPFKELEDPEAINLPEMSLRSQKNPNRYSEVLEFQRPCALANHSTVIQTGCAA